MVSGVTPIPKSFIVEITIKAAKQLAVGVDAFLLMLWLMQDCNPKILYVNPIQTS